MPSGADDPKLAHQAAASSTPGGSAGRAKLPGRPAYRAFPENIIRAGRSSSWSGTSETEMSGASDADFEAMEAAAYEDEVSRIS